MKVKERNEEIQNNKDTTYKIEKGSKKKIVLISSICASVLVILLILSTIFALLNVTNNKIIKGVTVANIDVNGLTEEEAEKKISEALQAKLEKEITFKATDFEYPAIKLSQIETNYDVKRAVSEAFNVGRSGNIFENNFNIVKSKFRKNNIDIDYTYNEQLLENLIIDVAGKLPDAVEEPSYYIEDEKLIIEKGKKGNTVDKEEVKSKLLDIIKDTDLNKNFEIDLKIIEKEPDEIDIQKIHDEIYREPKDAYYTKDPFEVFPHEDGINFDIDKAREILKEDKEEYEIPLTIIHPEITTNKIGTEAFPDLLSTFSTTYDVSNTPRTTNLILAMNKLNGTVVAPGEVFSYNKTLGKRTAAAGYKEAGGFAGGRVVQTLAGGICQISSTLYDAAVYANLDIIERHNHMFLAGYVGPGKDATVVYGSLDLKFKNTRKYPIMIKTSIGNGVAKISIFGIKEDVEYEVEISTTVHSYTNFSVIYENDSSLAAGQERVEQKGMNGCRSTTYKILKLNGKQVSSTVLSRDTYDPMNKIIRRGPTQSQPQQQTQPQPEPEPQAPDPVVPIPEPQPQPQPDPEPEVPQTPDPNEGNE